MPLQAGEGIGASGVCGMAAGEGLACLDGGSLTAGFFLLSKREISYEINNNEERDNRRLP
jgi:hypothetical protein